MFSWDFAMRRVHAFCYMICLWESHAFEPQREFLMRCHALSPNEFPYESSCSLLHNLLVRPPIEIWCLFKVHNYLVRCHAFWLLRDILMNVMRCEPYQLFVDVIFWWGLVGLLFLRVDCECNRPSFLNEITCDEIVTYAFWPLWDVLVSVDDFCCTIFLRDISGWDAMLLWGAVMCLFGPYAMSWWDDMRFGYWFLLLPVWCKDGGEVREIECIRWFIGHCVVLECASWVRWRGKWLYRGWWWLGEKVRVRWETEGVCLEVVWCVSPACMASEMFAVFGLSQYCDQGLPPSLLARLLWM